MLNINRNTHILHLTN